MWTRVAVALVACDSPLCQALQMLGEVAQLVSDGPLLKSTERSATTLDERFDEAIPDCILRGTA